METLKVKTVKIRKQQRCWGCAKDYGIGTQMRYTVLVDAGELHTAYWCSDCCAKLAILPTHWTEDGVAYGGVSEMWDEYSNDF